LARAAQLYSGMRSPVRVDGVICCCRLRTLRFRSWCELPARAARPSRTVDGFNYSPRFADSIPRVPQPYCRPIVSALETIVDRSKEFVIVRCDATSMASLFHGPWHSHWADWVAVSRCRPVPKWTAGMTRA